MPLSGPVVDLETLRKYREEDAATHKSYKSQVKSMSESLETVSFTAWGEHRLTALLVSTQLY